MSMKRPSFSGQPAKMAYKKNYTLKVSLPSGTKKVQAFLMDLGYSTHGVRPSPSLLRARSVLSGAVELPR